jgi:hypothetical protein
VDEGLASSAPPSDHPTLLARSVVFFSGLLDSLSFLFFCLPFSGLTHLLSSWCSRLLFED